MISNKSCFFYFCIRCDIFCATHMRHPLHLTLFDFFGGIVIFHLVFSIISILYGQKQSKSTTDMEI